MMSHLLENAPQNAQINYNLRQKAAIVEITFKLRSLKVVHGAIQ